jgi:hypothetical protein
MKPTTGICDLCARAASGHAADERDETRLFWVFHSMSASTASHDIESAGIGQRVR